MLHTDAYTQAYCKIFHRDPQKLSSIRALTGLVPGWSRELDQWLSLHLGSERTKMAPATDVIWPERDCERKMKYTIMTSL